MVDPTLFGELSEIVRSVGMIPAEVEIKADSKFVEDLGIDSFDMASIIFSVQDKYDLALNGEDLPALEGMAELAEYVAQQLRSAAA